eukprot:NODE_15_length_50561_cov_0.608081.p18 type:complete len:333 gc:universal NODE_15_length_50561_cov_0.608081:20974-21972(+)
MDYELLEELGSGSFGKVFRATNNNCHYAIKRIKKSANRRFIKPGTSVQNQEQAIKREIAILKKLNNDNCIKLIDALEDGVYWFLVFKEYQSVDPDMDPFFIFNNVLLGLEYIHAHDIVHLDVKPDNLLYDGKQVILCDFGLSVMIPAEVRPGSAQWTKAGTLGYTAPENIGNDELTDLSDLFRAKMADMWGLGMSIYHFEYKRLPFDELNSLDRIEALKNEDIIFKNNSNLSAVVKHLLDRNVKDRYDTDKCRYHITQLKDWPTFKSKVENIGKLCIVDDIEIEGAFKRVHFMATVIKAVTRFKRGSRSNADMSTELKKVAIDQLTDSSNSQ